MTPPLQAFWGVQLKPGFTYRHCVAVPFRVAMVVLDEHVQSTKRSTIWARVDDQPFVACNLIPGKIEQQVVDISFAEGETIELWTSGDTTVHLTGYYRYEIPPSIDKSDLTGANDSQPSMNIPRKRPLDDNASGDEELDELISDSSISITTSPAVEPPRATPVKKQKTSPSPAPTSTASPSSSSRTTDLAQRTKGRIILPNGLEVQDKQIGKGFAARPGDICHIWYTLKLAGGKVVDRHFRGAPFSFKVGAGKVVKGLDLGITGMKKSGHREIKIPPSLGYGGRNLPDIPKNSTLIYTVTLVDLIRK
ncbi:hypothetical protein DM01DRAFT_1407487 [Hesseltinella vesiculosa]|uniref:peptidylprolyl isomerase n=1 Tax=Hesseltinella vesiculosa TaxID=101127 RepID=A0A1X2GHC9_9FUNG|nr:hypothetical protein DM01DRAFT_1407487 [Hesseltinella vesiculosa]